MIRASALPRESLLGDVADRLVLELDSAPARTLCFWPCCQAWALVVAGHPATSMDKPACSCRPGQPSTYWLG